MAVLYLYLFVVLVQTALKPRPARAGPWDESLSLNDDGEYFCRVLLASPGMVYCRTGRSYYRSGLPGSLSQQRGEKARRSQFRSLELIGQHLRAAEDSLSAPILFNKC